MKRPTEMRDETLRKVRFRLSGVVDEVEESGRLALGFKKMLER